MWVHYCVFVIENGCKSVTHLLVAPVDVRNLHLGEFLTRQCHNTSVTGESLLSLTCQTPKTANIQGMMTGQLSVDVNIAYIIEPCIVTDGDDTSLWECHIHYTASGHSEYLYMYVLSAQSFREISANLGKSVIHLQYIHIYNVTVGLQHPLVSSDGRFV